MRKLAHFKAIHGTSKFDLTSETLRKLPSLHFQKVPTSHLRHTIPPPKKKKNSPRFFLKPQLPRSISAAPTARVAGPPALATIPPPRAASPAAAGAHALPYRPVGRSWPRHAAKPQRPAGTARRKGPSTKETHQVLRKNMCFSWDWITYTKADCWLLWWCWFLLDDCWWLAWCMSTSNLSMELVEHELSILVHLQGTVVIPSRNNWTFESPHEGSCPPAR